MRLHQLAAALPTPGRLLSGCLLTVCLSAGCDDQWEQPGAAVSGTPQTDECQAVTGYINDTEAALKSLNPAPDAGVQDPAVQAAKLRDTLATARDLAKQLPVQRADLKEAADGIAMLAGLAHEGATVLAKATAALGELQRSLLKVESEANDAADTTKKGLKELIESCGAAARPACKAAKDGIDSLDKPIDLGFDPVSASRGAKALGKRYVEIAEGMDKASGDDKAREQIAKSARAAGEKFTKLGELIPGLSERMTQATSGQERAQTALGRLAGELSAANKLCE